MSGKGLQNVGGGSFSGSAIDALCHTDAFQGQITALFGTADALDPYLARNGQGIAANYMVKTGSADAMTLKAPIAGSDDGLQIAIWSASAFAHSVTSTGNIQNGVSSSNINSVTLPAQAGSGVLLRAFNGKWQVIGQGGGTLVLA